MGKRKRNRVTFVIGGARSGKSTWACREAGRLFRRPLFVATAEPLDREMADRIARHRAERGPEWSCVEEPLDLASVFGRIPPGRDGVLVDCLTVWLSNVLVREGAGAVVRRQRELLEAIRSLRQDVIVVSNEVGQGIVPATRLGRDFRDYAGWLNQALAGEADRVVLVVAGIAMVIKGRKGRR